MEQEVQINQNEIQNINISSNAPQTIQLRNIMNEDINVFQNENQNIEILENKNQTIYIDEKGESIVITDILVNGVSVITDGIAYIEVPTKTSELINDNGFITKDVNNLSNYTLTINLSDVALSGSYNDLENKPTIPTVNNATLTIQRNASTIDTFTANSNIDKTVNINVPVNVSDLVNDLEFVSRDTDDLENYTLSSALSTVATTGDYDDLNNLPVIPQTTSELTNDSGYINISVDNLMYYTLSSNLSTVATTGDYDDLIDKPSIPSNTSDLNNDSGYITNTVNDLTNYTLSSALSTVATTGDYDDLIDKPSIPSNTSDLNNDSGFITNTVNNLTNYTLSSNLSTVATTGSYSDLSNKPSIPSKTSDLTNDSGFITSSDLPQDSGWQTIEYNNTFKPYGNDNNNKPRIRKIGKIVSLEGITTPVNLINSGQETEMFTIPSGYRPSKDVRFICQGSGVRNWCIIIQTTGSCKVARFGASNEEAIWSGAWLAFCVTYMIN